MGAWSGWWLVGQEQAEITNQSSARLGGRPAERSVRGGGRGAAALAEVGDAVHALVHRRVGAEAGLDAVPARRVAPALPKIEAIALWRERQEAQAAFVAARPSLVRILLGECSSLLLPCCGEER